MVYLYFNWCVCIFHAFSFTSYYNYSNFKRTAQKYIFLIFIFIFRKLRNFYNITYSLIVISIYLKLNAIFILQIKCAIWYLGHHNEFFMKLYHYGEKWKLEHSIIDNICQFKFEIWAQLKIYINIQVNKKKIENILRQKIFILVLIYFNSQLIMNDKYSLILYSVDMNNKNLN